MKKTILRLISCVMIVIMVLSSVPLGEFVGLELPAFGFTNVKVSATKEITSGNDNIVQAKNEGEFDSLVSRMVADNWEDNYFSDIIVDNKENTVTVDGVGTKQDVEDIVKNGFDSTLCEIQPEEDNSAVNLDPAKLEDMGCEVSLEKDQIHITKPFQTKRLILVTKDKQLKDSFGASEIISDGSGTYILQYEIEDEAKSAYELLKRQKNTKSVSVDSVVKIDSVDSSNNPLTENGRNRWGAERIESDRFKEYLSDNNKNNEVIVAVLDTGVEMQHPFLKDRLLSNGYDFVDNDNTPDDRHMHGTHCSGIIVDNTPNCVKILPVKVANSDGKASELVLSLGIDYAAKNGADIISMSISGFCTNDNCSVATAVRNAEGQGVVCVVSAGNDSSDTSNLCPARLGECITVSSVDKNGSLSTFSNYGDAVDVAAPGVNIWSSTLISKNSYCRSSGTSMATPFVSAAAAMYLVDNPSLTSEQVKEKIKNTTGDAGIKGKDISYGNGILDFGVFFGDTDKATAISATIARYTLYLNERFPIMSSQVRIKVGPAASTDKSYTVRFDDESIAYYDGWSFVAKNEGSTTAYFELENGKFTTAKVTVIRKHFWIEDIADSFAGGSGTQRDPYLVETAQQLARIAYMGENNMLSENTSFRQTADIDLVEKTWCPIMGTDEEGHPLRINYDGDGYKINNMRISDTDYEIYPRYNGLFARTAGELKNINIINAWIGSSNTSYTGGVCADFSGIIKNCRASGSFYGRTVGGLVATFQPMYGVSNSKYISNCCCDASLYGRTVGGIVGMMTRGTVSNCVFSGDTNGSEIRGGIVCDLLVNKKYTDSDFCEINNDFRITNCISKNNIVGLIYTSNIGSAKTDKNEWIIPSVVNCYYSGPFESGVYMIEENEILSDLDIRTEQVNRTTFMNKTFYEDAEKWDGRNPWDFTQTWNVSQGFPFLSNQKTTDIDTPFDYYEFDGQIQINGYSGYDKNIVIPDYINEKPVTVIGYDFKSENVDIESIDLPKYLKIIDSNAFSYKYGKTGKSIKDIRFSEKVEYIFDNAFYGCSELKEIKFPGSLKFLGKYAFGCCVNLESIVLGESLTEISPNLFIFCDKLKNIILPNGITDIGDMSFYGCNSINNLIIPESVKTIGRNAFCATGIQKILIPKGVISIGEEILGHVYELEKVAVLNKTASLKFMEGLDECVTVYGYLSDENKDSIEKSQATFIDMSSCNCSTGIHSYGYYEVISKAATCTAEGNQKRTCTVCGKTETKTIARIDHKHVTIKGTPATCTKAGLTDGDKCSLCGEILKAQKTIPATGNHTYGAWRTTKTATCTVEGKQERICSVCGKTETKTIAKTAHKTVTVKGTPATCTKDGKTDGIKCSVCEAVIKDQETIKAKGHNPVTVKAVAATCTKAGKTAGTKCSVCGAVIKAQETVKATGHSFLSWKTTKKATYTATGTQTRTCNVCGKVETKTVAKLKTTDITKCTFTVKSAVYTGKAAKPSLTVKNCKTALKAGTHYTITYKNNTKIGKATITIKGVEKNGYGGVKTLTFNILPANVKSVKVTQTTSSIKLTWSKVAGATGYRVFRYDGKKWVKVADTKNTTYTVSKLKAGTNYKYAVRAYTTVGKATYWAASYPNITTATKPPTPTIKVIAGKKQATVSWKKSTGANGYVVYIATSKNGKYKKLGVVKGTSYTAKKLTTGKTYYFKVRAYKTVSGKNIYSAYSSVKSVKVK